MRLEDFDYELPESRIAKAPAEPRDHSRLMRVDRASGELTHCRFHELGRFLDPGDLLVVNDTKVLPARLYAQDGNERRYEILLLKRVDETEALWKCLVRPGKRVSGSLRLRFRDGQEAEVTRDGDQFRIEFLDLSQGTLLGWLEENGELPLPPYLKRPAGEDDRHSYQTVYARDPGSVAAPTAGLHFTDRLLGSLIAQGVRIAKITLHVGYGTFSPVRAEQIEDHVMHEESYDIPRETLSLMEETRAKGKRIIAVGTTSLRALESLDDHGSAGSTDIFISPGYRFRRVDGLITNFHLPKSSLYILVAAMLGLERARHCYEEAIREEYRFYSYGDAMAII